MSDAPRADAAVLGPFTRSDLRLIGGGVVAAAGAAVTRYVSVGNVVPFVVAGVAVAVLAMLVGLAVEQLAERLGPGATGVVQSALGNLPELFIGIFALRKGLVDVVRAAVVGSILANVLLVLGLSFLVGGLRHGSQRFSSERARTITVLMVLAVAALLVPSLAQFVHTPAAGHERALSVIASVVLLTVFALSIPASVRRAHPGATQPDRAGPHEEIDQEIDETPRWPLWLAVGVLAGTGVLAALVSDWFVYALEPAMGALHISQAFAGLVVVAIAGNAVENLVGIQLASRNQADYALSTILNSPLQIALVLAPVLVLLSFVIGGAAFTLVLSPMLVAALIASVLITAIVILDGESNWLEGAALIGLYVVIATSFWWG